jgi:hypothetical protein
VDADRLERTRAVFGDPNDFPSSPLYRRLADYVATDDDLLALAAQGRPGQYPSILLFGAVHLLLLHHYPDDPLAAFYPTVAGASAHLPDHRAGPALRAFCLAHQDEILAITRTRLVQTSQVQRAIAIRIALAAIADEVIGPLQFIEVGCSVGLNLRFDRYGYRLGGVSFGDRDSPVQVDAELVGSEPAPDLDRLPVIADIRGVDLNPLDPLDRDVREWLTALVWPENADQRQLLERALGVAADTPRVVVRGDAIEALPALAAILPPSSARFVFHSATRMHVPHERRAAFDAAVLSLGDSGPLWWASVEGAAKTDPRPAGGRPGAALRLRRPDGGRSILAIVEPHLRWVELLSTR